ncbi:HTTM domain-containing protein [Streptomyces sp. BRA346]|uniref:HTTM domain-containing protein n=1 Tax=Streptomyces sp. BRA346 TaxID=2878199 RepID=UPI004062CAC0
MTPDMGGRPASPPVPSRAQGIGRPLVPAPAAPAEPPPGGTAAVRPAGAGHATGPRPPGRVTALVSQACRVHAPYQAAALRIGLAFVVVVNLLREWPHRRVLTGDRSPWSWEMAGSVIAGNHAFSVLTWFSGRWWFELVYHGVIVAAVLLMLGWRTRATSVLFMAGVLSLQARNPFVLDGGDNIVRLMAVYLVFTRCGQVWSLDARRARRTGVPPGQAGRTDLLLWQGLGVVLLWAFGPQFDGWALALWAAWAVQGLQYAVNRWFPGRQPHTVLDGLTAMLHNGAMLVVAAQVCLLYLTSSWYKILGSRWQDGTAVYYALHLDYYRPWPWLSSVLTANMLVVFLLTYGTVVAQLTFPFALLNRTAKNVLLAVLTLEHMAIGVVIGIPFMSLAVLVCDAVFLPTAFLIALGDRFSGAARRLLQRSGSHRPAGSPADGLPPGRAVVRRCAPGRSAAE